MAMSCQTPKAKPPPISVETRNNAFSLLHQLLHEEKEVNLIHFIKKERPEVRELLKKISVVSKNGEKLLEDYAKEDPYIRIDNTALPPGEIATRDSISAMKKNQTLHLAGPEQELGVLMAQAEALTYGWNLAKVASQNDTQPDRVRELSRISEQLENLYDKVFDLLLNKEK